MDNLSLYKKHFVINDFERKDLFDAIRKRYGCKSALYPGSFIHITPSFYFPSVIYVDSDRQAKRFFEDTEEVKRIIDSNKIYKEESIVTFIGKSYMGPLDIPEASVDLLISQYAGFVSKYCKKYLKKEGILLVNNSHGDAGRAYLDDDYQLAAAVHKRSGIYRIDESSPEKYFIPKKPLDMTISYLESLKKGIGYTRSASSYIFIKKT